MFFVSKEQQTLIVWTRLCWNLRFFARFQQTCNVIMETKAEHREMARKKQKIYEAYL